MGARFPHGRLGESSTPAAPKIPGEPSIEGGAPVGARFPHGRQKKTVTTKAPTATPESNIKGGTPVGARFHQQAAENASLPRSGRWRLRNWRLRSRLVVLLVIPLLLAGVLGGLRIASAIGAIQDLSTLQDQVTVGERVATVIDSLQTERTLAAAATSRNRADRDLVEEQVTQTNADIASMLALQPDADTLAGEAAGSYVEVLRSLGETAITSSANTLPKLRELASAPGTNVDTVMSLYTDVIAILLRFNRIALAGTAEAESAASAVAYIAEAKEQAAVQHALLLSASLAGSITESQQSQLRNSIAGFDAAIGNFSETPISSAQRRVYFDTFVGPSVDDRTRLLNIGLGQSDSARLDSIATEWDATASTVQDMLDMVETSLIDDVQEANSASIDTAVTNAIRDASIIALLLLFTLILLVFVARSVLRPLLALRTSALDVAQRRLPALVEQLRRPGGWKGNVDPEPIGVHTREDVGQVARAFDEVHKEAIRLATEQAMMRSTVNDMFANLSRRSQSMVERQLRIIDTLESSERDPEALGELFRLDHLATRMRRNNENLLVLAGSETRQRVGADRPTLDVLRGALSEIEEYQRITIEAVPDEVVRGVAVNDLVHLTAELLDNATSFSPEQAQVVLASSLQPDGGLLIEIRDFGVGMSATQRNAINDRLAVPPMVDVSVSRHMGLFVVGRLAARHGISVRMQVTGSEGGLTAAVSVPSELIVSEVQRNSAPAQAAAGNGSAPTPPSAPAATGSLWDAARNSAPATAGTGAMFEDNRGASMPPAAADSGVVAAAAVDMTTTAPLDSLFSAAAASTLNSEGQGLAGQDTSQDLFAASVPASNGTADFFTPTPQSDASASSTLEATPIFQEMRSAWFRQRPGLSPASTPSNGDGPADADAEPEPIPVPAEEFQSSADEGWRAAEQLRTRVDAGTTSSGLPRRRPRAHLVPGATARPPAEADIISGRPNNVTPLRDAERVRGNLSSYQRGTRRGRHSTSVEDSERSIGDPTRNGVGRHGELPTSQERQ